MSGSLFQFPKTVPIDGGTTVPGANAYFYQTGTTTPQNVYTDIALSVAHPNPVVADADGVFAPIYLDGSLPDYRVKLTDSSGTQIYQVDDIPSSIKTVANNFTVTGTAPYLDIIESDATANSGGWRIKATGDALYIYLTNDALSTETEVLKIARSATTFSDLTVNSNSVATKTSGTFTGVLATGLSSSPFGTVNYSTEGTLVKIWSTVQITGTSNATVMTMTGMPAAIRPSGTNRYAPCTLFDNTALVSAYALIDTAGTITFYMGSPLSVTGFTSSGTKGIPTYWSLIYSIS